VPQKLRSISKLEENTLEVLPNAIDLQPVVLSRHARVVYRGRNSTMGGEPGSSRVNHKKMTSTV
jgi:hypothetical protein